MDLFEDMEVPTDMIPFILAIWAAAIAWQLFSGAGFLGLPDSTVSRKKQPEFYWVLLLSQVAAVGWIYWRYV